MQTKVTFDKDAAQADRQIVYVRPVPSEDLPEPLRAQVGRAKTVYSMHSAEGAQLALVKDRRLAFALARQNDMAPVHVH
jgi:hypothetical protein